MRYTKNEAQDVGEDALFDVRFVPLVEGAARAL